MIDEYGFLRQYLKEEISKLLELERDSLETQDDSNKLLHTRGYIAGLREVLSVIKIAEEKIKEIEKHG